MQATTTIPTTQPQLRRWTREEYYQMGDLGFFQNQRVQLIEGGIVIMSPQKFPHVAAIDKCHEVLEAAFGENFWVRMQAPLTLGPQSEPEPDVSVVEGKRDDYQDHPTTALLVAEVSRTTLPFDRQHKASLYAKAGIADCWIVNLTSKQLGVLRNPEPDEDQPYGFRYAETTILKPADSVSPLAAPESAVRVADMLP